MRNTLRRVCDFYIQGFRSMDVGRVLWVVVLVKLFIIFVVLRCFFFRERLSDWAGRGHEAEYVYQKLNDQ